MLYVNTLPSTLVKILNWLSLSKSDLKVGKWWIYGKKLELIKALKVLNEGLTIGLHVNCLGFRVRV